MSAGQKQALADLKQALAAGRDVESAFDAATCRIAELQGVKASAAAEIERLKRAQADREADAIVLGDEPPEPPAAEAQAIARAERQERGAVTGIDKLRVVLQAAEADRGPAKDAKIDAALSAMRAARDPAQAEAVEIIESLRPALARLWGASLFGEALTGTEFSFDQSKHPVAELWDAGTIVGRFLAAIPPRLRPAGFAQRVESEAQAVAAAMLAKVEAE